MEKFLWWRDGVIYQIYPRSFADSNGDGVGDLNGITAKLDYLADLGVDALWLSPFYPTPDRDFGYDISNYVDVDPRFGTLADFDRLVAEAHRRGIRIVLDMVLNHTSDQHPWFQEAKSSRDNPKRDWYVWSPPSGSPHFRRKWGEWRKTPRGAKVPTNWQASFGGSTWEYDVQTGEYYLHSFMKQQPDLNWRNPETRQALFEVMRFWLERGADGFRFDVFNVYFKDAQFRDNPSILGVPHFFTQKHLYDYSQPEMLPLVQDIRRLLDSYPERYAVGETYFASAEETAQYCGPNKLHAAFNFEFTYCRFNPEQFLQAILRADKAAGETIWPNYVLGNHDIIRPATRFAPGFLGADRIHIGHLASEAQKEDDARAKILMALLLTQRGTPFLYYGDEIGMRENFLPKREIMDPLGKVYWPLVKGRDGCRTPMQWDASAHAGFSSTQPWNRLHPDYRTRNVETQRADPTSLLNLTRDLLRLRKQKPALVRGDFIPITPQPRRGLVYRRELTGHPPILVALNFSNRPLTVDTPGFWTPLVGVMQRLFQDRVNLEPYGFMVLEQSA